MSDRQSGFTIILFAASIATASRIAAQSGPANVNVSTGAAASADVERRNRLPLGGSTDSQSGPAPHPLVVTPSGWFAASPAPDNTQPAPWNARTGPRSVGGSVRFGSARSWLSVGVVGTRDYKLPLFMSTILAGPEIPTPAVSSLTDMSRGSTSFQVVTSMRRTFVTTSRGITFGVAGDIFLPVGAQAAGNVPGSQPALSSRAIRFGLTLGF